MPNRFVDWLTGNRTPEGRKGLGYRYIRDPRSDAFLMSNRFDTGVELPPEIDWPISGDVLDQGQEGSCVGHGWGHWVNAADSQTKAREHPIDHAYCLDIYNWAQNNDEWSDTPPGEGTSVLAGAKACVQFKHLKEGYVWGKTAQDLVQWLGLFGPVVMGSLWTSSMRSPRSDGFMPGVSGTIDGGHCYLARGYMWVTSLNPARLAIKFRNSWGKSWGVNGDFYMWIEDVEKLLSRGNYSMCSALELAPEPAPPAPPAPPPEPQVQRINLSLIQLYRNVDSYRGRHLTVTDSRSRYRPRWNMDPVSTTGGDLSGEEQKEGGSGQEGGQE